MRGVIRWFLPHWRARRRGMLLVLFLTFIGMAGKALYPWSFKFVIDALTGDVDVQRAHNWILLVLGIGVVMGITQWLLPACRYWMGLVMTEDIRIELFSRVLQKGHRFFQRFRTGDLITRLTDDLDSEMKVSWYSCSGIMRPVEAILTLLFSICIMLTLNWQLTLLAVLPLPLIVWVMSMTEHVQERAYARRQKETSSTVAALESAFSGVRIVIGYAAEQAQSRLLGEALKKRVSAEERVVFLRSLLESLGSLMNQAGLVIVLFVGGYFVIQERMTIGDFYAFVAYLSGLTETIWTLSWFFVSTKMVETSIGRLKELNEGDDIVPGTVTAAPGSCELSLEDVRFGYAKEEERAAVLQGVSFTLAAGECVALVGPVGCGKSTLLAVAAGIYPPDSGAVRLGGEELAGLAPGTRAALIGLVPQESTLFSGEVAENVSMGRDGVDAERVAEALATAVVLDEFPPDKVIAQGGVGLSGGQRGRVAIARAVAGRPPILLMDDATAALDAATEEEFWRRLRRAAPDCAVLVSTHREATARIADRVLWLEDGDIAHAGTHQALLAEHAGYQRLFARD